MGALRRRAPVDLGEHGNTGGSQPLSLMQPVLGINYIICIHGIDPSRS